MDDKWTGAFNNLAPPFVNLPEPPGLKISNNLSHINLEPKTYVN